jgi:hypothetical protein
MMIDMISLTGPTAGALSCPPNNAKAGPAQNPSNTCAKSLAKHELAVKVLCNANNTIALGIAWHGQKHILKRVTNKQSFFIATKLLSTARHGITVCLAACMQRQLVGS